MQNQGQQGQAQQGAVGIPLQIWSHHFDKLHMELKTGNVVSSMRTFDGEGQTKFTEWLRDMEKAKVITGADDENMRRLAAQTLHGSASEFVIRVTKESPRITWVELRSQLRKRFSDLADVQFARQALKRLKQGLSEGTHNFAERIRIAAEEAFPGEDPNTATIQVTMIEVFIDGLGSDYVAKKLIKLKPDTLKKAVEIATGEELASKAFTMRRREEPMDIDYFRGNTPKESNSDTMSALLTSVSKLTEQMTKLTEVVMKDRKGKGHNPYKYTKDNKPICAKCDLPGHIAKNCRRNKKEETKNE